MEPICNRTYPRKIAISRGGVAFFGPGLFFPEGSNWNWVWFKHAPIAFWNCHRNCFNFTKRGLLPTIPYRGWEDCLPLTRIEDTSWYSTLRNRHFSSFSLCFCANSLAPPPDINDAVDNLFAARSCNPTVPTNTSFHTNPQPRIIMSVTVCLGSQFGDEGKGKLVDILANNANLCCRAQGGNNAGHTIVANGKTFDFHILPSGLINPKCINLVGSGCVVHVPSFFKELEALEKHGLNTTERIFISDRAHVVFDLHQLVDGLEEVELANSFIGRMPVWALRAPRSPTLICVGVGTTRKGIGKHKSLRATNC